MTRTDAIRVLQIGSPTGLYGAERWILALVGNAAQKCVEFTVAVIKDAPGPEPPLCAAAANMGIPTHVFEANGKTSWRAVRQLRRFVEEKNIHVIHTHGYKPDILAAIVALQTPCRIVATPHGWSAKAGLKLKLYEALDRLVFARFDAVAPLSQELYDGLTKLPWLRTRTALIPNGVDLSELDNVAESQSSEEILALKRSGDRIIGYVGQLIPRKGLRTLIRAVAEIDSPVKLIIVGDGPERKGLERFARQCGIEERVEFAGFRSDRLSYMRGFDIFVLPSELEGVPRCLMECMALGVPVIASNIPGSRTLVQPGTTGTLFEAGDFSQLKDAITTLLHDTEKREDMAARGRQYVREHFSATAMFAQYLDLYRRLVLR